MAPKKVTSKARTYKDAGVDIDAGEELIRKIKPLAKATQGPEVLDDLGGFGALFALAGEVRYKAPVLVSSTDGCGTKVKIASALNKHDTIGIDLVAMVVNDLLTTGADPLFFLDYFATGRLDVIVGEAVIGGIAEGCKQAGCALIGGETAEMPGVYAEEEYDLAGFGVGIVERDEVIDGSSIRVGSKLIGLASSGVHSNGFSLIRRVFGQSARALAKTPPELDQPLGELLLTPTKIYVKTVLSLIRSGIPILAAAHITGGGIIGNLPRVLPSRVRATVNKSAWTVPPIFDLIMRRGHIPAAEMWKTFNMGIGMILVVGAEVADDALSRMQALGEDAWIIGDIAPRAEDESEIELV